MIVLQQVQGFYKDMTRVSQQAWLDRRQGNVFEGPVSPAGHHPRTHLHKNHSVGISAPNSLCLDAFCFCFEALMTSERLRVPVCSRTGSKLSFTTETRQVRKTAGFYCRNLIKKPWPYNPQYISIHIRNPNRGPRFLNQVPTLT